MKRNNIRNLCKSIFIFSVLVFSLSSCGKLSSFDQMVEKYQSLKDQEESEGIEASEEVKKAEEGASIAFDFVLPENIEITFLGDSIFKKNYDRWQFSLYERGATHGELIVDDTYLYGYQYQTHPGYAVKRIEKGQAYTGEGRDVARIEFGENGLLYSISIYDAGTSAFSISGLQVGENAKDYLNGIKDGLWSEFEELGSGEFLRGEDGWTLTHGTFSYMDEFYDQLSFTNNLFGIIYNLENEVVHDIYLQKWDNADEALLTLLEDPPSILDINPDRYQLLIDDMDLYTSLPMDWVNHFGLQYIESMGRWTAYSRDGIYVTLNGDEFYSNAELSMGSEYILEIFDSSQVTMAGEGIYSYPVIEDYDSALCCSVSIRMPGNEYVDSIERTVTIKQNLPSCERFRANHILPGDDLKTYLDYLEPGLYGRMVKNSYQTEDKEFVQVAGGDTGDGYQILLSIDEEKRTQKKRFGITSIYYNLYGGNADSGIIKEIVFKRENDRKVAELR